MLGERSRSRYIRRREIEHHQLISVVVRALMAVNRRFWFLSGLALISEGPDVVRARDFDRPYPGYVPS